MSKLSSPSDPLDIWQAIGEEVPQHRMLMQGDLVSLDDSPVVIVTHACSMRRGATLHEQQMVAEVMDQDVPKWDGSYDWMPLLGAPTGEISKPAASLRTLRTVPTELLCAGGRLAVMSDQGIQLLQQRLAHQLTRIVVEPAELAEHCAPILAECELHEDWVGDLGSTSEDDFHAFLDADDRKLRGWLHEPAKRPQAIKSVRQEIRRRATTN